MNGNATDYAAKEIDFAPGMRIIVRDLEQLKTIYRIQFPVLQSYEADTWYDRCDREQDYNTAWALFEKKHGEAGGQT